MRRVRVALVAVIAAVAVGCGDTSTGSKEEKPLPANRIPKTGEPKK
jgi:hypothetical protein